MQRPTGAGKYFIKVDPLTKVVKVWIYNYDIEGFRLKPEHMEVLNGAVGPLLRDGGNIKLLGFASTTGQVNLDKQLSEQRMQGVVAHLQANFGSRFGVSKEIAFGKDMALAFGSAKMKGGTADQTESEIWRAVVVNAWNRNTVPPPPPGMDVPLNSNSWANDLGQAVDKVSIGLGIVDLAADLAALETVTAVTGPAGLVLGCVQAVIAMPLLWAATDAVANANGQIQGAADAIQDMADQFRNDSLDRTPLSKWPAVQAPTPHISTNPQATPSEQAWRAGQAAGCRKAVEKVLELENNPKPITLPDGRHIRLSGRLWLRVLSHQFKDNAGVEIVIKPANEELKKQGKRPFPTI
jgi:hypothetical protein